jgi:hypothetical protein
MRKRKWWIVGVALLSLAWLGWRVLSPPPLPPFLQKFEGHTTLLASGHGAPRYTVKPSCTIQFQSAYFVDAPPEEVVLAYADSIKGETIHVSRGGTAAAGLGAGIRAIFWKEARMTEVNITREDAVSKADQWLTKMVPGWLDVRFGRTYRSRDLESVNAKFYKEDAIRLSELKGLRPNLKLYPNL